MEDDAPEVKPNPHKKKVAPHKNSKHVHQLGGFKPQFQNQGFNNQGFNNQGFNNQGFNNQGYNNFGYPSQNSGFSNYQMQGNWGGFGGSSSGKGEKYPVSTSTRTSTETRNGKTVTKVI